MDELEVGVTEALVHLAAFQSSFDVRFTQQFAPFIEIRPTVFDCTSQLPSAEAFVANDPDVFRNRHVPHRIAHEFLDDVVRQGACRHVSISVKESGAGSGRREM